MKATRMIRKQLYITREQDRSLKRKARELGLSEAELVRRAIDGLDRDPTSRTQGVADDPLRELIENMRRLASKHKLPEGYKFDRDELYDRGS